MNRTPEKRGYDHLAEKLAQQFSDGQNVDTGNLTYLRDFSDESRVHYNLLMDRVADMYDIVPRDQARERASGKLGGAAINLSAL